VLAHRQRDLTSATACAQESLSLCSDLNDEAGTARSIAYLGLVAAAEDEYERAGRCTRRRAHEPAGSATGGRLLSVSATRATWRSTRATTRGRASSAARA
jgi:hypothetical protein